MYNRSAGQLQTIIYFIEPEVDTTYHLIPAVDSALALQALHLDLDCSM